MKKKNPTEELRKKCVKEAKDICKILAGWKCEYCGRSKEEGWQIHGSHIKPESVYKSMSADVDNIIALCARCHTGGFWRGSKEPSWHEDPLMFIDYFSKRDKGRFEELEKRSKKLVQMGEYEWSIKLKELKAWKKELLTQFSKASIEL